LEKKIIAYTYSAKNVANAPLYFDSVLLKLQVLKAPLVLIMAKNTLISDLRYQRVFCFLGDAEKRFEL